MTKPVFTDSLADWEAANPNYASITTGYGATATALPYGGRISYPSCHLDEPTLLFDRSIPQIETLRLFNVSAFGFIIQYAGLSVDVKVVLSDGQTITSHITDQNGQFFGFTGRGITAITIINLAGANSGFYQYAFGDFTVAILPPLLVPIGGETWLYGTYYDNAYALAATGHVIGSGTIAGAVTGTAGSVVESDGGLLILLSGMSGGTLLIEPRSKVVLPAVAAVDTVTDDGVLDLSSTASVVRAATFTIAPGGSVFGIGAIIGPVTNRGTIEAHGGRLAISGAVANDGTVEADGGAALALAGTVTNGGLIQTTGGGLTITGGVTNDGIIQSTGGPLTILGAVTGDGTIDASGGPVTLRATVTGAGALLRTESDNTLELDANVSVGSISVAGALILGNAAATVTASQISVAGAFIQGAGTLAASIFNDGYIFAAGGLLKLAGAVSGDSGHGLLGVLASGTMELAGPTTQWNVTDSGTLRLDGVTAQIDITTIFAGATLTGSGAYPGFIDDEGLIAPTGSLLLGGVTGGGSIEIGDGASLELTGTAAVDAITFASGRGSLLIDQPGLFNTEIANMRAGDRLVFNTETVTSVAYLGVVAEITVGSGASAATLLAGGHSPAPFLAVGDGGHVVTYV